jgi:hypothetical protein
MNLVLLKELFLQNRIVLLFYFSSHLILALMLGNFTGFALDEFGYAYVVDRLYEANQSTTNFSVWVNSNLIFLQILYLPAKLMTLFGLSTLFSIRLYAIFMSTFSLMLLLSLLNPKKPMYLSTRLLVFICQYIPSFFLWTSLGLRESFLFFWFTTIFYACKKFIESNKVIYLILLGICSVGIMQTKLYLYVLLCFSFLTSVFIFWWVKRKNITRYLLLIFAILSPQFVFPSTFSNVYTVANETIKRIYLEGDKTPEVTPEVTPENNFQSEGTTAYQFTQFLDRDSNSLIIDIIKYLNIDEYLISNTSPTNINSLLKISRPNFSDPKAITVSVIKFLLLPIPFLDNGSIYLNIFSLEMFIWYSLYCFLLFKLFNLRSRLKPVNFQLIWPVVFLLTFVLFSGLFEINLGTIVRHRAVLLVFILFVLVSLQNSLSFKTRIVEKKD